MDKGSKHPFSGEKVFFATLHGKEKVLAPLFEELGLTLEAVGVDTDSLGTFSGEIERTGSMRETLKSKINLAVGCFPNSRFFLASEGSFGPHPLVGLLPSDLEALLFFDKTEGTEIYVEHLSMDVTHEEVTAKSFECLAPLLKRIDFPSHAVIVRPLDSFSPLFKGIQTESELESALSECVQISPEKKALVATDLRSMCNPTRQKAIYQAGQKLIEALQSLCPCCRYPGFAIMKGLPGLPCSECGEPSRAVKKVILSCTKCFYSLEKPRPDGLEFIEPAECEICNP